MAYSVTIETRQPEAWFDCKADAEHFSAQCEVLSLSLPRKAGQLSVADPLALFNVAPRHWLLRASLAEEQRLLDWAQDCEADNQLSVVWVSDQYCGFDLSGDQVDEVLAQASPLDTSPAAFPAGSAGFTDVFGTRGLICREGEPRCYSLYVERSYSDYIAAWLAAACGRNSGKR